MKIRIVLASLLFAGSVAAEPWNPPARFDRPYTGGPTRIIQVPGMQLMRACRAPFGVQACARLVGRTCEITIPRGVGTQRRAELLRHERGHCNGWPGHHPD